MNWGILVFRQYQQRFQEGIVSDHLHRWALVDATGKAKWIEEAAKDKERFNRENAAYLAKQNGPSGQEQAEHSNVKQASLANVEGAPKQADEAIDGEINARSNDCDTRMELKEEGEG